GLAGDFFVEPVEHDLGLAQGAFGADGGFVFFGQTLGRFAVGGLGGNSPLFTSEIAETGGPIFRKRVTPDAGHRLITIIITSIGVLASPLKYNSCVQADI